MINECFENRELSWLKFNERVLEEAEDSRNPLCERATFLSIFQTNLDEFFMVRIGSLTDQQMIDPDGRDNKSYMTAGEQIEAALARIRELCVRKDKCYHEVMDLLNEQGISIVNFRSISPSAEAELRSSFKDKLQPFLSTYFFGKSQYFPFLKNKEIYAVALLSTNQGKSKIAIVPCGNSVFPRLIPVPGKKGSYILAEEFILHFLPEMFTDAKIVSKTLARITRNADIDADSIYDEDLNYRDHMAEVIEMRTKLAPVRLELSRQIGENVIKMLCKELNLNMNRVYGYETPLDLSFLFAINDELRSHSELFYVPRAPQYHPDLPENESVIDRIRNKDMLLHYPYQSIRPFLRLLSEAAHDKRVTHIRMTLYRVARNSKVIESLVEAAENGKNVEVFVELKARFDEENNISWSRMLEQAGCKVTYGIEHIKVHSKLCQITLKGDDSEWHITQIGTGNYNEKTSRLYTDLCLMTADEELAKEASAVFEALKLSGTVDSTSHLLVSPHCMQNKIIDMIDQQIIKVKNGESGRIRMKVNGLSDKSIIIKLIEASCAGVKTELVVRGVCCLKAGVPNFTDNITIRSIVGRYLEHSRIYIFGEDEDASVFISSADLMTRNMLRRVEIGCPIRDEKIRQEILGIFETYMQDNMQAREMKSDGKYVRVGHKIGEEKEAQNILWTRAADAAQVQRM